MIGTRLGSYEIVAELGSGGMGTVWRAVDADGAIVAIKTVHPHLLARPGFFKRFLREADVGASVRHENVVSTLDKDALEVDGTTVLYLVMEYVEGETLRDLLGRLGVVPEALLREIAVMIAAGLSAIHEQGYVHRDLKPENVLITGDHDVRIMDMGVARLVEESSALTQDGQFAGSLLYAAPEQFGSEEVGPAADLYALGVLLYEMASGQNPFRRDGTAEIIHAHVDEVPRSVTETGAEVTPFLAEVVSCLLLKAPKERFASASALRELLEEGERSSWWSEREASILKERAERPKVPVQRVTSVYGREEELEVLRAAWSDAREARGRMVLLEGEAGIGKSRLVDTFLQTLGDEPVHVLYGSYPPSGGLGGLSDAVLGHFGAGGLESSLRPYLQETPRLVPTFAAMLKHEAPPEGATKIEGEALHAVFRYLLDGLAVEQPVVWIVEDLHFATPDSRAVVLALARSLTSKRVLLVGTTRPGIPEPELAHFSRLEHFARLGLGRLGAREVIQLLQDAFQSRALAEKLGGKIAYKSDGVPFFVFEMIRGLREGQFLRQLPDGSYVETRIIEEIEVPSAVRDLIQARLGDLSFEERNILDAAAAWGFDIDSELVARACDMKRIYVLQRLAEIERRSGVVRNAGRTYRFDHHQIQEVIYETLAEELRAEYHTALAEALATRGEEGADLDGETAYRLAWHHLRGTRPEAAAKHLLAADDHLMAMVNRGASLDLLRRAYRAGFLKEDQDLLLRYIRRLEKGGELDESRSVLKEAEALATEREDPIALAKVRLHDAWDRGYHRGRVPEALRIAEECLEVARREGDKRLEFDALGGLKWWAILEQRIDDQLAIARARLALSRDLDDPARVARAEWDMGSALSNAGDIVQAIEYHTRVQAAGRELGDREMESTAAFNVAGCHGALGHYDRSVEACRRQIEVCHETGWTNAENNAARSLAGILFRLGDIEGGAAMAERAYTAALATGTPWVISSSTVLRGHAAVAAGDDERALDQFQEALAMIDGADGAMVAAAHTALGFHYLRTGEPTAARPHLEQALSGGETRKHPQIVLHATIGLATIDDSYVDRACDLLIDTEARIGLHERMHLRFHLWRATGDLEHLTVAHDALQTMRTHAPEQYRDTMIENVKLHREIVEAWAEHG